MSARAAALAWLLVWSLMGALAMPCLAQTPARVVLLVPTDEEPAGTLAPARVRLHGELTAAGFEVVELGFEAAAVREGVEAATREADAVAALALVVVEGGAAVDVWLADDLTGKTLVRRVALEHDAGGQEAARLLALRAVELLQASLVELELARTRRDEAARQVPAAARALVDAALEASRAAHAPPAPPRVEEVEEESDESLGLGVEVAAALLVGDGHVAGAPALRLAWHDPGLGLGARLSVIGPALGTTIEAPGGDASVVQTVLLIDAGWRVPLGDGVVVLRPSLGLGAWHVAGQGRADAPRLAREVAAWSLALDAGLGAHMALGARLALQLELHALAALPAVSVVIDGADAATLGRPSGLASFGVVVGF